MITLISKIQLGNESSLASTSVGYTYDEELIVDINKEYDSTLGGFLGENRTKLENNEISISEFFNSIEHVFEARIEVETLEGLDNLNEVTDINDL